MVFLEESYSCYQSQSSRAGETGSSGTPRRRIQTAPPVAGHTRGRHHHAPQQGAGAHPPTQHSGPLPSPDTCQSFSAQGQVNPRAPTQVHFPELNQTSSMPYTIVRVNRTNHPSTHIGVPESLVLPMVYQLGVHAESPSIPINPPVTPRPQISGPFNQLWQSQASMGFMNQLQQDNLNWVTRMSKNPNQIPKTLDLQLDNRQSLDQNQIMQPNGLPNIDSMSIESGWAPPSPGIADAQLPRVKIQPSSLEDCRPASQKACMSPLKIIIIFSFSVEIYN